MSVEDSHILRFARVAFERFPKDGEVRQALLKYLQGEKSWEDDDCALASRMLQTGSENKLKKLFAERASYGQNPEWDEALCDILKERPQLAGKDPRLLQAMADVFLRDGEREKAYETLMRLRATAKSEERDALTLRVVAMLPAVFSDSRLADEALRFKGEASRSLELASALKDIALRCRLPADDAVDLFETWESFL